MPPHRCRESTREPAPAPGRPARRAHPPPSPTSRAKPLSRDDPFGGVGKVVEKTGRGDQVGRVHRPRDRDIEPVAQQQELEPTRGVAPGRRCEGHDGDGRLLTLEAVDRADRDASEPGLRQRLLDRDLLRVVRRDDDDVGLLREGVGRAAASPPSPISMPVHSRPTRSRTMSDHDPRLLERLRGIAPVSHRAPDAGPARHR